MNGLPCLAFIFESTGLDEWAVLGAVVFILFGPKRLPDIAKSIGRTLAQLRRAADEFRAQVMSINELETPPPDASSMPPALPPAPVLDETKAGTPDGSPEKKT